MARPSKYANAAERQAAYRERYEVIDIRVTKETGETLKALAAHLDTSRNELVNSMLIFALLNRNWAVLGLFGKRLPYAKNPIDMNEEIGLWKHNSTTGMWRLQRMCLLSEADKWLEVFQKDEPHSEYKLSKNKPRNSPNRK